jgi:3-deoxy-7-phosphoheptulonate synthase
MDSLKIIGNKGIKNTFKIGDIEIGKDLFVIAGPCAVESETQIIETAKAVSEAGANMLRGGAFKPRTSPYSFQGLGEEGLKLLAKAREATGLLVVTEVVSVDDVALVAKYADILQIGARNMQNFALLSKVGQLDIPIILKRGLSATIEEWVNAAEYIAKEGNAKIIMCERGIRTYEKYTRNTLDLSAVPIIQQETSLPIIVDPSHGTGKSELILAMSLAGVAAGADGLIIEAHINPSEAISDADQTITPKKLEEIITKANIIRKCFE